MTNHITKITDKHGNDYTEIITGLEWTEAQSESDLRTGDVFTHDGVDDVLDFWKERQQARVGTPAAWIWEPDGCTYTLGYHDYTDAGYALQLDILPAQGGETIRMETLLAVLGLTMVTDWPKAGPTPQEQAESKRRARAANPALTVFDTGEMLEPVLEMGGYSPRATPGVAPVVAMRKTGTVEFTNDESAPVFKVFGHPSTTEEDTTVIQLDIDGPGLFKIVLGDATIWRGYTA